jgi:hypothetical protein
MAQVLVLLLLTFSVAANEVFKVKSFKELKYEDVVQQTYEETCGASSLATLMNLYGMKMTEQDLITDLSTTDIVNFLELKNIAYKNGFKAEGYNITKEVFEQLKFPVIARVLRHSKYPHFIVAQNINGDFILSFDPNNGKRLITKNEFYSAWNKEDNGHILVILPENGAKLKNINFLDTSLMLIK